MGNRPDPPVVHQGLAARLELQWAEMVLSVTRTKIGSAAEVGIYERRFVAIARKRARS